MNIVEMPRLWPIVTDAGRNLWERLEDALEYLRLAEPLLEHDIEGWDATLQAMLIESLERRRCPSCECGAFIDFPGDTTTALHVVVGIVHRPSCQALIDRAPRSRLIDRTPRKE